MFREYDATAAPDLTVGRGRSRYDLLAPVGIDGAATLATATVARIMIAGLDHLVTLPPEQRREPLVMARWLHLLGDLWALRATIG